MTNVARRIAFLIVLLAAGGAGATPASGADDTAAAVRKTLLEVGRQWTSPAAHVKFARLLFDAGRDEDAFATLEFAEKFFPDKIAALWEKELRLAPPGAGSEKKIETGKDRIAELEAILKRNPDDLKTLEDYSEAMIRTGGWAEARKALDRIVSEKPERTDLMFALSEVYRRLGNHARADEILDTAHALAPEDEVILGAILYFRIGARRFDDAHRIIRRALDLDPRNPIARANLAAIYAIEKKYEEAAREYRFAVLARPNELLYRLRLAKICEENVDLPHEAALNYLKLFRYEPYRDATRLAAKIRMLSYSASARLVKRCAGREDELLALLEHPNPHTRESALKSLGNVGTERAAPAVYARFGDVCDAVRFQAARTMAMLGERVAGDYVGKALGDENPYLRAMGVYIAPLVSDPTEMENIFKSATLDPSPVVRTYLMLAVSRKELGEQGDAYMDKLIGEEKNQPLVGLYMRLRTRASDELQ